MIKILFILFNIFYKSFQEVPLIPCPKDFYRNEDSVCKPCKDICKGINGLGKTIIETCKNVCPIIPNPGITTNAPVQARNITEPEGVTLSHGSQATIIISVIVIIGIIGIIVGLLIYYREHLCKKKQNASANKLKLPVNAENNSPGCFKMKRRKRGQNPPNENGNTSLGHRNHEDDESGGHNLTNANGSASTGHTNNRDDESERLPLIVPPDVDTTSHNPNQDIPNPERQILIDSNNVEPTQLNINRDDTNPEASPRQPIGKSSGEITPQQDLGAEIPPEQETDNDLINSELTGPSDNIESYDQGHQDVLNGTGNGGVSDPLHIDKKVSNDQEAPTTRTNSNDTGSEAHDQGNNDQDDHSSINDGELQAGLLDIHRNDHIQVETVHPVRGISESVGTNINRYPTV